jgi:site-specific recombinase XerD
MRPKSEYYHLKLKFKAELKGFEKYLKQRGLQREYSPAVYLNYTACFLNWMKENSQTGTKSSTLSYYIYIDYCRDRNDSTRLINRKLASIRKYYEYLELEGKAIKEPCSGLFLKGKKSGIPNNLLTKEELQKTYESYISYDLRTARNKA